MRRNHWSLFLVVAATMVVALVPASAQERPNVVIMLADNLGFGDLSVYNGGTRGGLVTPNIDALAAEGMRFTQFLVEPGCTPSRAASDRPRSFLPGLSDNMSSPSQHLAEGCGIAPRSAPPLGC